MEVLKHGTNIHGAVTFISDVCYIMFSRWRHFNPDDTVLFLYSSYFYFFIREKTQSNKTMRTNDIISNLTYLFKKYDSEIQVYNNHWYSLKCN